MTFVDTRSLFIVLAGNEYVRSVIFDIVRRMPLSIQVAADVDDNLIREAVEHVLWI